MILSGHQPEYLPWAGFFDKISRCGIFLLGDTLQYREKRFHNRNKIKTRKGWQWLTVPVKRGFPKKICDAKIDNGKN